jgi:ketol-acid reductoisomerase
MRTLHKTLVVILLYMVFVISYTAAATTGTLVLTAYVPERAGAEVVSETKRDKVDLTGEGGIALVGTIKENTTTAKGYAVEVSSANAQKTAAGQAYLAGATDGEYVDYQILYGGEMVSLQNGRARLSSAQNDPLHGDFGRDLAVAYSTAGNSGTAAAYTDTLTLSVIAN